MEDSERPVVGVASWAGSSNLGDELVLAALLAKLEDRGAEPLVLSIDPAATAAVHGAPAISLRAVPRLWGRRPAAVLMGGGGLLQDETSPFNLPYHLGRADLLAGRRAPVAGVGLGAGPITGAVGRRLVPWTLRRAVAVSVRDRASVAALAALGVEASLAADLAVSLPTPQVQVEGRLAVSLRPWTGRRSALPVGLRRHRRAPVTPSWFPPAMARALDEVTRRTGLGVHFVALQADRDDPVHHDVARLMRSPATFAVPDVHTVVAEITSCQAAVAMRYHAGIAAVLGGRPAVLIGYSPKVPSLAAEVPGGMVGLAWDEASLSALPVALEQVLNRGDAVVEGRERLREREKVNDQVLDRLLAATAR